MIEGEGEWPVVHNVGDIVVQAGFVLGPRTIPDYELVYFPAGSGTEYELTGKRFRLDVPCFVFTRPGESHLYRFAREKDVRPLFRHTAAVIGPETPYPVNRHIPVHKDIK